jgi:hypothetical protein
MSNPDISYRPRLDATPEAELEALAAVYSFLIQCRENRKAVVSGGCADTQGGQSKESRTPLGSGGPSTMDHGEEGSDKPANREREEVITE